ncbi:RING-H2 finger protein [Quillaja saponaria]|uniref:RING-type E3 ubiquitin transferase n=1 Tax=Quillaja saponaria TaxID=32244 RepID=A0AAD7PFY8_QUISA|nr:RING-H2 finger protein [Quillaja saponaria]KAJ7953652.1 RING-H2 finger protein [Quillaja saponaria]
MSCVQSYIRQSNGALTSYPLISISNTISSPSFPYNSDYQKLSIPPPSSSSASKLSPSILFIIVILAVILFLSGLLHLVVRYVMKQRSSSSISESNRYPEMSGSDAFQRQLQQLFHLHDSGLDQAFIDALPVFLYKEIIGLKEPFDCAVCLCEFSEQDNLRLLPLCNHAFHIDCIDTWLLSNSTCPLCRGTLYAPGLAIENPIFDFEYLREEDGFSGNRGSGAAAGWKPAENSIVSGKRVFSVRLGKFRSSNNGEAVQRTEGESSNSNLDVRRCYSMGSFQYVVANSDLQVALCPNRSDGSGSMRHLKERAVINGNSSTDGDIEGKKLNSRSKGESFSVSKIWQWSKKGKFPSSSETHMSTSAVMAGLPLTNRTQGT